MTGSIQGKDIRETLELQLFLFSNCLCFLTFLFIFTQRSQICLTIWDNREGGLIFLTSKWNCCVQWQHMPCGCRTSAASKSYSVRKSMPWWFWECSDFSCPFRPLAILTLTPKLHSSRLRIFSVKPSQRPSCELPLLAGFSHWILNAPVLKLTQCRVFKFCHVLEIYCYKQQGGRGCSKHCSTSRALELTNQNGNRPQITLVWWG